VLFGLFSTFTAPPLVLFGTLIALALVIEVTTIWPETAKPSHND
jgi:hypothetical protein